MERLSRTYGWTPEQILEQPADVLLEYVAIGQARDILEVHNRKGHGN